MAKLFCYLGVIFRRSEATGIFLAKFELTLSTERGEGEREKKSDLNTLQKQFLGICHMYVL